MKTLKDKIYELEGLVELADMRPDKFDDLRPLIQGRLEAVMSAWQDVCGNHAADAPVDMPDAPADVEDEENDEDDVREDEIREDVLSVTEPVALTESIEPYALTEEVAETETVSTPAPATTPTPETASATAAERNIALCVNDRFRFARLLAKGDRAAFDNIMKEVASKNDFEEARDYLIDNCNLDPSDPDAVDLLEIVQQFYE